MIFIETQELYTIDSFTENLSKFILYYLKRFDIECVFSEGKFELEECFDSKGFLPLFLYRQEHHINQFINNLNDKYDHALLDNNRYYANITFIDSNLYYKKFKNLLLVPNGLDMLDYCVDIKHNLNSKDNYDLLSFLAKCILSDKILSYENNIINLDQLFDETILKLKASDIKDSSEKYKLIIEQSNKEKEQLIDLSNLDNFGSYFTKI